MTHNRHERQPLTTRIRSAVAVTAEGCWEWRRSRNPGGYGLIYIGSHTDDSRRVALAHRISYEAFVGPIPDGFHVDHLCRNRACVNPDHLEAVTPLLNARRRSAANDGYEVCARGHRKTKASTVIIKGKAACRTCVGVLA